MIADSEEIISIIERVYLPSNQGKAREDNKKPKIIPGAIIPARYSSRTPKRPITSNVVIEISVPAIKKPERVVRIREPLSFW